MKYWSSDISWNNWVINKPHVGINDICLESCCCFCIFVPRLVLWLQIDLHFILQQVRHTGLLATGRCILGDFSIIEVHKLILYWFVYTKQVHWKSNPIFNEVHDHDHKLKVSIIKVSNNLDNDKWHVFFCNRSILQDTNLLRYLF